MPRSHPAPCSRDRRRGLASGFTMIELLLVLVVAAALFAIALRPLNRQREKLNARSARVVASQGLALARSAAVARGCPAVFHLQVTSSPSNPPNGTMWVTACRATAIGRAGTLVDTLGRIDTPCRRFDVTVTGTADSIRYDSRGFTANYATGAYAFAVAPGVRDTLTITSMGRV